MSNRAVAVIWLVALIAGVELGWRWWQWETREQ